MARTYEYWTVKDGEDIAINLTVVSFSVPKGAFSPTASDPDDYHGSVEIEWQSEDDLSHMTDSEISSMEEWLVNEHSEYLAEQDYYDCPADLEATMNPSIQGRREVLLGLRQRSQIATADFYQLAGISEPARAPRFLVSPAGLAFFHIIDSRTGKVKGFHRDHNAACAFARKLEQE